VFGWADDLGISPSHLGELILLLEACMGAGIAGTPWAPRGQGLSLWGPRGVGLSLTGAPASRGVGRAVNTLS